MLAPVPRRAFFQFEFPIRHLARLPRADGDLRKWRPEFLVPPLVTLEDTEPFADVYWGWHADGLAIAFDVPGRTTPLRCDPVHWWKQDGVRICIDTRDARDVKRATRFCHFFYVLPAGAGRNSAPQVGLHRMSRAKEPPPPVDAGLIRAAVRLQRRGYVLEVVIPASCLFGWDPVEHRRLGVFYKIKDLQHGSQHLSVDDELGWNVDPSTWATGVLVR